ncbi:MAG: hypothetical protein IT460_06965 [Planctomycetes bacterium]|nr:hypothetical protein [Planctomycetota bacterium]
MSSVPPSSPPPSSTPLKDRMLDLARQKPTPPRAKFWLWTVLFVVVGALCLGQLLGWTRSPVADKIRDRVESRPPPDAPSSPR